VPKKSKHSYIDSREREPHIARSFVWIVIIVLVFSGVLTLAYKMKHSVNPLEYEGKVVDKWAGYTHSQEGSFPYFRLLLETDGGQRLTVAIDRKNFERAKIGMRIKKTRQGIELAYVMPIYGVLGASSTSVLCATSVASVSRW